MIKNDGTSPFVRIVRFFRTKTIKRDIKHQTIKKINDYEKAIITICDDVATECTAEPTLLCARQVPELDFHGKGQD